MILLVKGRPPENLSVKELRYLIDLARNQMFNLKVFCICYTSSLVTFTTNLLLVSDSHGGLIHLEAIPLDQVLTASNVTEPSRNYSIINLLERNDSIIQITILNLTLAPGDLLTFYDGNTSHIIEQYTSLSASPSISVTSMLPTAHVEFTANTSNSKFIRSFAFLYLTVQKGMLNFYTYCNILYSINHCFGVLVSSRSM